MHFIPIVAMVLLLSCSGSEKRKVLDKKNEHIKRDYVVTNASSEYRPGWIEDATQWAKQNREDTKQYRYFSFETDTKSSRKIACDLARANGRAMIAGEISTSINRQLTTFMEGQASLSASNPEAQALQEYVETTLKEQTQAHIHGTTVVSVYWEKRQHKTDLGASHNFAAWTCANLIRLSSDALAEAVREAKRLIANRVKNNDTLKKEINQVLQEGQPNP